MLICFPFGCHASYCSFIHRAVYLLPRFPRHFPYNALPDTSEASFDDMHEFLSSRAPFHRQGGGARKRSSREGNVGHSAKSVGTAASSSAAAAASLSEQLNAQPVLLWSVTGNGIPHSVQMRTRGRLALAARGRAARGDGDPEDEDDVEDEDDEFGGDSSMRAALASKTSYGMHMVVRGYNPRDCIKIGRGHNVALEGVLGLYLQRTSCPATSTYKHVAACPVAVPPNASRLRMLNYVYGSGSEYYTEEEDEEVERIMEEEMRRMFRRPRRVQEIRGMDSGSGWGERKTSSRDGGHGGGGGSRDHDVEDDPEDMDWGRNSAFRVEEFACASALDVSPRVYPLIVNSAGSMRHRTRSMLFQYAKGSKGIDEDQFVEITEALFSKADIYDN